MLFHPPDPHRNIHGRARRVRELGQLLHARKPRIPRGKDPGKLREITSKGFRPAGMPDGFGPAGEQEVRDAEGLTRAGRR